MTSQTHIPVHPRGIAGGLDAFVGGIGFIIKTPAVWGYALVPILITLVLMAGLWLPEPVVRWFRAVAAQLG